MVVTGILWLVLKGSAAPISKAEYICLPGSCLLRDRRRRFFRRTWFVFALAMLPLPPYVFLLTSAADRDRRSCPTSVDNAMFAALCIVLAGYLLVRLVVVASSVARGQTAATARQLQALGIAVAVGIAAYASLALKLLEGLCL